MNRSQIRTLIKRTRLFRAPKNHTQLVETRTGRVGFVPVNNMNFMNNCDTIVSLDGRLFRLRKNEGQWLIDVSCKLENFDRWANSKFYDSVPLSEFAEFCKYLIKTRVNMNEIEALMHRFFQNYPGTDNPSHPLNTNK